METVIIIPARYGSTRFPGKPLHVIAGVSMIERVWRIARQVTGAAGVYIATDDERIRRHVLDFGGQAILTPPECRNGTERVFAACAHLESGVDAVINFQGDAVLTPPWIIQRLVDAFTTHPQARIVTPAVRCLAVDLTALAAAKEKTPASGTMVVFNTRYEALYFSKAMIPHIRNPQQAATLPAYRHIGLYGYRLDTLGQLCALPPTPLEQAEQLEQLRALEHGIPIQVVPVDYRGRRHWSVDSPEDAAITEQIIAEQGELI
jgi:3-deoxy-manno-octulosonate cytidylyltransferase (CMP-KDO synthetase)